MIGGRQGGGQVKLNWEKLLAGSNIVGQRLEGLPVWKKTEILVYKNLILLKVLINNLLTNQAKM